MAKAMIQNRRTTYATEISSYPCKRQKEFLGAQVCRYSLYLVTSIILLHYGNKLLEPLMEISIDDLDVTLCRVIWVSVIVQAAHDLAGKNLKFKREAERWVTSEDYQTICHLLDMEPSKMGKFINGIMVNGRKGFNFQTVRNEVSARKGRKRERRGDV